MGWHDARKGQLAVSLAYIAACLDAEVPRSVDAFDARPPARLFTDGSCESGTGGAGAVLYHALVELWSREGDAQLIAKFELVPILAALLAWGSEIAGRRLLIFVDNNGVRDSLIKGSTPVPNLFSMLALIAGLLSSLDITPWYTRVASKSNPADGPSRGEAELTAREIGAKVEPPLTMPHWIVQALLSSDSFLSFMSRALSADT